MYLYTESNTNQINISGGKWCASAQDGTKVGGIISRTSTINTNSEITGGKWTHVPDEYLTLGYASTASPDAEGYYSVTAQPFIKISSDSVNTYNTLQDAIDAAQEGDTITLLRNGVSVDTVTFDKNLIIDVGSYNLELRAPLAFVIESDVNVPEAIDLTQYEAFIENEDGSKEYFKELSTAINHSATGTRTAILNKDLETDESITYSSNKRIDLNGHNWTFTDDNTIGLLGPLTGNSVFTVDISNSSDTESEILGCFNLTPRAGGATLKIGKNVHIKDNLPIYISPINDYVMGSATVEIYGKVTVDVADGETAYAAIQGNGQQTLPNSLINIYDGAVITGGIYHPQDGVMNIEDGATINGSLEVKAGEVNITGGTFVAPDGTPSHTSNSNGTSTSNYCIALVENAGYDTDGDLVKIKISGGTFEGKVAKVTDSEREGEETIEIIGGTFDEDPSTYVAKGYEATESPVETWIVGLEKHTVTFESNDGTTVSPIDVESGTVATKPTAPTKNGYNFSGWFTDDITFANEWDFANDKVKKDITLYAKWTPKTAEEGKTALDEIKVNSEGMITDSEEQKIVNETVTGVVSGLDKEAAASDEDELNYLEELEDLFLAANSDKVTEEFSAPSIDSSITDTDDMLPLDNGITFTGLALSVLGIEGEVAEDTWLKIDVTQKPYEDDGTTLVIEAKPMISTISDSTGYTVIPNSDLNTPVTVRLYLPENFLVDAEYADVEHIKQDGSSEIYRSLEIKTDSDNMRYVDITVTEFSEFKIAMAEELVPTPESDTEDDSSSTESDTESESTSTESEVISIAKTGDESNMILFAIIGFIALAGAGFITLYRKNS